MPDMLDYYEEVLLLRKKRSVFALALANPLLRSRKLPNSKACATKAACRRHNMRKELANG